ncbi:hypothetical protein CJI97_003246 [Candidozyma auris]|nr:hypothetical protein CJI97_003246 [[Candida] auris]
MVEENKENERIHKENIPKSAEADDARVHKQEGDGSKMSDAPGTSPQNEEIEQDPKNEATEEQSKTEELPKRSKSVGFAPEPHEDLKEHHQYLDDRKRDKQQSNPFQKIPPELAYLDSKSDHPKPLPTLTNVFEPKVKAKPFSEMRDRRCVAVKDISVINKQTELNFNYWETPDPCKADCVLVDVKFVSLTSYDISKLSKYLVNLSNTKVGLGFDFVGKVIRPGQKFEDSEFAPGTTVFGVLDPHDRKGSLSTAIVVAPARDILIAVPDEVLTQLESLDVTLSFSASSEFTIGDADDNDARSSSSELFSSNSDIPQARVPQGKSDRAVTIESSDMKVEVPNLAKLTVFGSSVCRVKSALSLMDQIFKRQHKANILINGGDTHLAYTFIQILFSSVYSEILDDLNVILIVKESSLARIKSLASRIESKRSGKIHVISFDMENEDIVLPNEKVPINYKKIPFFAAEIIEAMISAVPANETVNAQNIDKCKLDLFIDIVGSKNMFQHGMSMTSLNEVNFPFKKKLSPGVNMTDLFGKSKGPLFEKLMKPKTEGCSFVSFCKFTLPEPSYSISNLVDFTSKDLFNPWSAKWSQGFANQFVAKYSYYEKFDLETKKAWVEEGLRLLLKGELKFDIQEVVDWRHNFKKHVNDLKIHDAHVIFEIETF